MMKTKFWGVSILSGRQEKIIKESRWKNKSDGKNVFEEVSVRDVYMNNFKWKFLNITVLVH